MSLQRLWKWDMSCIKFSSLSNYFVVVLYYDNTIILQKLRSGLRVCRAIQESLLIFFFSCSISAQSTEFCGIHLMIPSQANTALQCPYKQGLFCSLNGHLDNTSLDSPDIATNESLILSKLFKCSWRCSII